MCGIAGVVSYTRDLDERNDLVERMGLALAPRGPDEDGSWLDRHAALAFRRNAVVDPDGGRQPMVARDGTGRAIAVLLYTGEVFNTEELRATLTSRGHRLPDRSDTAVVLHSYLEWGERCGEHLRGMFAFAVWDLRDERLVMVRDRFGIYPLCYAVVDDGLVFGSEPKAVFRSGLCEPVVDADGLRELLAFTPTPGRTVFRGVAEVVPGEVVVVDRRGVRRSRYWELTAAEHVDDYRTTVRTVRDLLDDAVRSQLVSDVPLGVMLSGGLDSSAIGALVAAAGGRRTSLGTAVTEPLRTYSMEFAFHLDAFRPDEQFTSPDSPYAHLMSRHLGSLHQELLMTAADSADPDAQRAVVAAMDRPTARMDMYVAAHRLAVAARRTSKAVLAGDGADELFGGYRWFADPERVGGDTFPWLGRGHEPEEFCGLLDRQLVKELALPDYVRERYLEALAEVPRRDGEPAAEARMRELTYLHLTRYVRVTLDRKDRTGAAAALEGRVPFCDHPLAEYVFNVPWSMKRVGGREKSLLRAAVQDLLPAQVLDRRKSPFPKLQDPAYDALLRERLQAWEPGAVADLFDRSRVDAAASGPGEAARAGIGRLSVEMALMIELWIREQGVTVTV